MTLKRNDFQSNGPKSSLASQRYWFYPTKHTHQKLILHIGFFVASNEYVAPFKP